MKREAADGILVDRAVYGRNPACLSMPDMITRREVFWTSRDLSERVPNVLAAVAGALRGYDSPPSETSGPPTGS